MANEKKCWACHRVIIGKDTLGLCPDCVNKYGTPTAAVAALGLVVGGRYLVKNGGKILKAASKAVKIFKA